MIELRLPLPPPLSSLTTNVRGRGRVPTRRYMTWRNAAGWIVKAAKPKPIKGDYALWLYFEQPDRRKRDIGNLEKAVSDLLVEHGVIEDDSKAAEIHIYRAGPGKECTVRVEKAPAATASLRRAA